MSGLANTIAGGGIALVMLYVTLFMINAVADIHPDTDLYDYSYSTTANSTEQDINSSLNASYMFSISAIADIESETPTETITVITNNSDASNYTVSVWLNNELLTNFISIDSTETTEIISSVSFVANSDNNISLSSTAGAGTNLSSLSSTIYYADATTNTDIGDTFTSITSTVDSVFSVQSIIIIIVMLAVAIGSIMVVVNSASSESRGESSL